MSDQRGASATPTPPTPPRRPQGGTMFGGRGMHGIGMPTEKPLDFKRSTRRLLARLRHEHVRIVAVIVLAVTSVVLNVAIPKVLGHATDLIFSGFVSKQLPAGATQQEVVANVRADGNGALADALSAMHLHPGVGVDMAALRTALLWACALFVGASLFAILQGLLLNGVVQRTIFRLREDVETKINRLPLSYFDVRQRGEVLSRVTNDIDNIAQSLQQTLSRSINALLTVIGVLVMMFTVSPLLALIALISIPLSILITTVVGKRSQKLFVAQWANTGALNGHIEDAFTGHAIVKAFGRMRDVESTFAKKNEALFASSFGAQFMSSILMPAMFFVGNLTYVTLAVVGGFRVASGAITVGDVQAIIQYSRQFTQPLTELATMANSLQSGIASAERVFELLDADEMSSEPKESNDVDFATGRVAFDHVSFRYKANTPLISDLSLVAEPGSTVAIVGPTGAGKTTLVNLVMRFYDIDSGRITIDGVDIATMPRAAVRSRVGMVLQDAWLFEGTIRDNIAYGNANATDEMIQQAAIATHVDRFVQTLPDGYNTLISDGGSNISAGERQLITIARAFLSDPALLILDEATSSVDTRTEVLVQKAMAALRSNRTSFVIAHRLSTIRDADLILVMQDGDIVEQGTHDQLLQGTGGVYADLYRSQFEAATSPESS